MLRGEHDKSDRRSSSALDRGIPSRASYLTLIITSMPTFSYAQIWPLCAAGPSCTAHARGLWKRTASIHVTMTCVLHGEVGACERGVEG